MLIYVPYGKTLLAKAGGYVFEGPDYVDTNDGFRLEETYTDGSPLEYVDADSAELPNSPDEFEAPAVNCPQDGQDGEGAGFEGVRGSDSLRESDGPSFGASVFRGELGDPDAPGN